MQFTNHFQVSLPPEEAWPLLMDLPAVVPCMPGAEIVERIDDRRFKGKVSVRLGPVGLVFLCDANFTEIDDERRRAIVQAEGADAKGRGTAQASIQFHCQPSAVGSEIVITTDLTLAGAVAQYGRGAGLIQNVANQIVAQFARNLEARIKQIKEHEKVYGVSGAARQGEAAPVSGLAGPAVGELASRAIPTEPAYGQGYRDGFGAGFNAGHAAGLAAAAALQRSGIPPAGAPGTLPPIAPAKPIGGISLIFSSLWATVRGWFGGRTH